MHGGKFVIVIKKNVLYFCKIWIKFYQTFNGYFQMSENVLGNFETGEYLSPIIYYLNQFSEYIMLLLINQIFKISSILIEKYFNRKSNVLYFQNECTKFNQNTCSPNLLNSNVSLLSYIFISILTGCFLRQLHRGIHTNRKEPKTFRSPH